MAVKPSEETALRQSPSEGHSPKGLWVAQVTTGGELFIFLERMKIKMEQADNNQEIYSSLSFFKTGYKKLVIVTVVTAIITLLVILTASKSIFSPAKNKAVLESSTPTPVETSEVLEDKTEKMLFPTQKLRLFPTDAYQPTLIPTPLPTQTIAVKQSKVDSAVGIEQCRAYAKEKRKEEERKVNEEYARSEPAKVELAAAQNNNQTEAAALKYGIITQSQVVRRTEVFEKLLSEGYPISEAEKAAAIAGDDYSTYLRSLHEWAVNELNKWNTVLKDKFDTYENQVYQSCLSTL